MVRFSVDLRIRSAAIVIDFVGLFVVKRHEAQLHVPECWKAGKQIFQEWPLERRANETGFEASKGVQPADVCLHGHAGWLSAM
jgi:hypothetical protein